MYRLLAELARLQRTVGEHVIGLVLFYTFISAMVLAGNGAKASLEASISASPLDLFFGLVESNLGGYLLEVHKILLASIRARTTLCLARSILKPF